MKSLLKVVYNEMLNQVEQDGQAVVIAIALSTIKDKNARSCTSCPTKRESHNEMFAISCSVGTFGW